MNQKVKVGVVVVIALAAALALPVMHSINKEASPQQQASASIAPTASPITPPPQPLPPPPPPQPVPVQEPLIWEGTYEPPPKPVPQYMQERGQKAAAKGKKDTGPDLTAETLVGTAWQVNTPQGSVMVEFGANGQGAATHPMVGAIPATWRVQGNKVVATASFMGQSMTIDATIQGQTLTARGQSIQRVR